VSRSAFDYALALLAARAYTERGMRRKLAQRSYPADECEAALERLVSSGLVDDRRYAIEFARQRLLYGSSSPRRVEQQLAARGIARDVSRAAIAEVSADEPLDTEKTLLRLIRKKLASMGDLDREVKRRRVFAFLARRGFDLDDIKRAIGNELP
jgi:regulatory protein